MQKHLRECAIYYAFVQWQKCQEALIYKEKPAISMDCGFSVSGGAEGNRTPVSERIGIEKRSLF
nr:MAG TPA: hypothetical protein [Caudoviricetes sp.]